MSTRAIAPMYADWITLSLMADSYWNGLVVVTSAAAHVALLKLSMSCPKMIPMSGNGTPAAMANSVPAAIRR